MVTSNDSPTNPDWQILASGVVPIARIRTDGGTQLRAYTDPTIAVAYAEAQHRGVRLPNAMTFYDADRNFWLADGFQRLAACVINGAEVMNCDIRRGTLRDATRYAMSANGTHGARRTLACRRNSIMKALNDAEWSKGTVDEIREMCGDDVTVKLVRTVMAEEAAKRPPVVEVRGGTVVWRYGSCEDTAPLKGKRLHGSPQQVRDQVAAAMSGTHHLLARQAIWGLAGLGQPLVVTRPEPTKLHKPVKPAAPPEPVRGWSLRTVATVHTNEDVISMLEEMEQGLLARTGDAELVRWGEWAGQIRRRML